MAFYDLSKDERSELVALIRADLLRELQKNIRRKALLYFSSEDTYIRKSAYLSLGRIYFAHNELKQAILALVSELMNHEDHKVRQTAINAAGEIGKVNFEIVKTIFDRGLFDPHHSPRNAVIGSVKKMGEVNPKPVLSWAKGYLHHPDKEIRREICHGIELRGRRYPEDILPLLQELEHDKTARVRNTLVHVIGQIAYKKGCLETVIRHLKGWENKVLVKEAIEEIIDVYERYKNFTAITQQQAIAYIQEHYS